MAIVRGGKVYDGTSGNVLIGNISDISPSFSMKTDETAVADDTAAKPEGVNITGQITVKGKLNCSDAGQSGLWTKFLAGTHIVPVKVVYSGTVGGSGVGYSFDGVISDWKPTGSFGKYTEVDITISMYGLPTQSSTL
jgi:hypothetical protein